MFSVSGCREYMKIICFFSLVLMINKALGIFTCHSFMEKAFFVLVFFWFIFFLSVCVSQKASVAALT